MRWAPGLRRSQGATLRLLRHDGGEERIELEPLLTFRMRGLGYTHPEWGHGHWHGEHAVGSEEHKVEELDNVEPWNIHIQQVMRARWGDKVGLGVLEQLAFGEHRPERPHRLPRRLPPLNADQFETDGSAPCQDFPRAEAPDAEPRDSGCRMSVTLSVLLWAWAGREAELIEYEDTVLPFVADHGGAVLYRARTHGEREEPNEIHLIQFPSEAALDAYIKDPASGRARGGARSGDRTHAAPARRRRHLTVKEWARASRRRTTSTLPSSSRHVPMRSKPPTRSSTASDAALSSATAASTVLTAPVVNAQSTSAATVSVA